MTIQNNLPALSEDQYIKEYGWTKSQFEVIQRTYFKGLSLDEIKIFAHVCKQTKLDPFLKQIYAIPRGKQMTIQTSIDGYRTIAERTQRYSPGRESTYQYDKDGHILSCTSYVKKMTPDGTWHEVGATAYFKEYNAGVNLWVKMPHVMIAKCAEAIALRKAFPNELSAIYTEEEMHQADKSTKIESMDIQAVETKIEPIITSNTNEEKISKEQVEIIKQALEFVSDSYYENFSLNIKKVFNADSYEEIPAKSFKGLMTSININIEQQNKLEQG